MQVHITISGEGGADLGANTISTGPASAGNSGVASSDAASAAAPPGGTSGNAINAGSAPSALAFSHGEGSGGGGAGHHQGASDQSAGPAPQF